MMTRVLLFCFSLFINGVFGVDVMKGDSVTLQLTSEERNTAEKLIWSFTNKEIAKIDLEINKPAEYRDDRFKDRIYLSRKDGSLTIYNIRTEDRGEYKLEIRSSGETKYKTFNVYVIGVFVDIKVSVMTGDDVTLHVTSEEIKRAEKMTWTFTDKEIANIDVKNQPAKYPDNRFKGRLYLSPEDGSLTIHNIRTEDSGEYKLKIINSGEPKYKIFNVAVTDQEFKVSVVKGDSFTLPTGVHKQKDDVIEWKFNDIILTDGRFTNIHESNNGDLNITNIREDQYGKYDVKINGRNLILHKTFRVNVNDEVKKVSAIKGAYVTLSIDEESHRDDVIEWKFKNNSIAKLNKTNNLIDKPDTRLDVDWAGSLIIFNVMTEDSGVYDVHIVSSAHIINKRFNLTVTDEVKLSKIKGENVSLKINETLHSDDVIEWKFNYNLLAKTNKTMDLPSYYHNKRFAHRLNVDWAGSLIIFNITTEDSGHYDVNIVNSARIINKRFHLTVTDHTEKQSSVHKVIIPCILVAALVIITLPLILLMKKRKHKKSHQHVKKSEDENITLNKHNTNTKISKGEDNDVMDAALN